MLDSGGISGGTNWWSLRIPEMWSMIETHDPATHQHVIGAWKQSYELVLQHLSGVERYRAGLAAAWPPEKSPAAAAYLERLDALIASLRDTYEAAVDNHRALAGATGALDSARKRMEEIQREHAANELLLAGHQEEMRTYQLAAGKAKGVPPQAPVADGRQAELEEQARRVMSSLSSELALAQVSLIQPKPYRLGPTMDDSTPFNPGDAGTVFPLPTTAPSLARQRKAVERSATPPPSVPHKKPAKSEPPGRNLEGPTKQPSGPALGQVDSPPASSNPTKNITPSHSGSNQVPAFNPNVIPPNAGNGILGRPSTTTPSDRAGSRGQVTTPPNKQYAMPPGGLIGGPIGSKPTSPSSTPTPRRMHPVGGLLGQTQSNGSLGTSGQPRNKADRKGASEDTRWDPDNPWETTQGVAPVIKPPPEPHIDPGPALGRQ